MSDTPPSSFLHSPAVVVLVKGAVLIGALAMLFWGVRSCITAGGKTDGGGGKVD